MNRYRKVLTKGDPLNALRKFLLGVWQQSNLDGMLVPIDDTFKKLNRLCFIDDPKRLSDVNPFNPIMMENAACKIPGLLHQYPKAKLGLILHPCEMRAVIESSKLGGFTVERLLTISIDCLKTFTKEDYSWWAKKLPTLDELSLELLQFSRQGGIAAYRYRPACQMCVSPKAKDADINISVIGLPVSKQLLTWIPDEVLAKQLNFDAITDGFASPEIIAQHEKTVSKLDEYHNRVLRQVTATLQDNLAEDIDAIVSHLEECSQCEVCMDVCPICSIIRPQKSADGHYERGDIIRWLVACAGCGMCEQACLSHFPLSTIFRNLRESLI